MQPQRFDKKQINKNMKYTKLLIAALFCIMAAGMYAANCTPVNETYVTASDSYWGAMTTDNSTVWTADTQYKCAKGTAYNKGLSPAEVNLFTPALNLSNAESVTIEFDHAHKFCGTPSDELTLYVTKDFKGSYDASVWQQLTIDPYGSNNDYTFVSVAIEVPVSYIGSNTVFAFHYKWTASKSGTWEIRNINVASTCAGGGTASPVTLPNVGEGRLKVFAQNLKNYYFHPNTGRGDYTTAEIAEKTRKLIDAMMWVDADIFALCEVEAQEIVLVQLADSMNKRVEGEPYVAVMDGINVDWSESSDNNIKSGFIYRNDKVKTVGQSYPGTPGSGYYSHTMRIQTFEELSSKERFTLSMNHFKAKDNTDDKGNAKRVTNANNLISSLNTYASDPDILVLGDLNCEVGEEPITIILNAGYEEQLLKYNASAFSHCYNGGELIDHVMANASMAEMITGAGVYHISTSCGSDASKNYNYRYSDHDPYVVAFNLPEKQQGECEDIDATYLTSGFGDMTTDDATIWKWSTYNNDGYAKASKSGGVEGNLFTPEFDLSEMNSVSLSFSHAHKFAGTPSEELTLWVTKDFKNSYASSEWQQLTISPYTSNKDWNFSDVKIDVPTAYVGENTVFAFHYKSTASNYGTWEIKNLNIKAACNGGTTETINSTSDIQPKAVKLIENGHIYIIMPDGSVYNAFGQKIQ